MSPIGSAAQNYSLDEWWPRRREFKRRGRSAISYTFARQAYGPVVHSRTPYNFVDVLTHQNQLVMHQEDTNPVYRGDLPPRFSCAGPPATRLPEDAEDNFSDSSDEDRAALSTPGPDLDGVHERLSSPLTPLPPSPGPFNKPLVKITYLSRDKTKTRQHADPVQFAKQAKLAAATAAAAHFQARYNAHPSTRRSRRLRRGRHGDSSDHGVWVAEQALRAGYLVHPSGTDMPRPLVDSNNSVMAVVVGAPKDDTQWWHAITKKAAQDLRRMYRNSSLGPQDEAESKVRFGLGYGDEWGAPYDITYDMDNGGADSRGVRHEIEYFRQSEGMKAISAYQNHIYQQFFPKNHADVASRMNQLQERQIVAPPFEGSVFTTCEISFCDAPRPSRKNYDSVFHSIEVITSIGDYKGDGIIFAEDEGVLAMPPGSSVAFPAGSKRYTFEAVAPHETRFLIRQFCHAGILRWVDKGGRNDAEFEMNASAEEKAAWEAFRETRGQTSAKLFSKLGDMYTL